jgi:hypothetical protein
MNSLNVVHMQLKEMIHTECLWIYCVQDACYREQVRVFGSELRPVDYDGLRDCQLLERCLKETLRLRPPIMTMMRMCKTPLVCSLAFAFIRILIFCCVMSCL